MHFECANTDGAKAVSASKVEDAIKPTMTVINYGNVNAGVSKVNGRVVKVEEFIDPRSGRQKKTVTVKSEDDLFDVFDQEVAGKKFTEDPDGNYWTREDGG